MNNQRTKILKDLKTRLEAISIANGCHTDFARVEFWSETPTEYKQNIIVFRDVNEKYTKKNNYVAALRVELVAIVIEEPTITASELGNLALEDLMKAVSKVCCCNSIINLIESHKFVDTKGVTACQVELLIDVKYQF